MKVYGHGLVEERVFGEIESRLRWGDSTIEPERILSR